MMKYHAPFNKKQHKKNNKARDCASSNERHHNNNYKKDLIKKNWLNVTKKSKSILFQKKVTQQ